ncbi:MAG: HD domain-containing protein [Desulfobacteraceae bacterium]|jgi:HD-GYP domain-containing protein (c-di-GMP phosphodiesterase class II)
MDSLQGALILEKIPNEETENKIIQFLSQYTKTLSQDKLRQILKKTPVVLIKSISESEGKIIEKRLNELGGTATFQVSEDEQETDIDDHESYIPPLPQAPEAPDRQDTLPAARHKERVLHDSTFTYILQKFAEVNKELWIILSLLAIVLAMNYLLGVQRMLLGLYTIPTLISAYTFGRRHATLTAVASILLVVLFTHFKPELFTESISDGLLVDGWSDIAAWGGILIITAYAMGTLYERNVKKEQELLETYQGLTAILRQFISNDQYTQNHGYRVSIYAAEIASYMNFSPEQIENVRSAALLHDLGKLEISRNLLDKAARLTEEEYQNIKIHVKKGVQRQKPLDGSLKKAIPIILSHQEHYEGSGYYVLKGKDIPIEGRVLAVADVYDSLVSDSPYRKAMSPYEAKKVIENGAGTDFDPRVVQAFLEASSRDDLEVPNVVV